VDELSLDAVVVEDTLVCGQDGLACGEVNTNILAYKRRTQTREREARGDD
jgi:hypothetical protein